MALRDILMGTPGKFQPLPTGTPEQQALQGQLVGGLSAPMQEALQYLSQILSGSPEALEAYRAPAMREFREEIVPGLAERFSGMGAGAQGSSAFGQQMGAAGASLAERLAAMKAQQQQQAVGQLGGLYGMGMQPAFQWGQLPGTQGALAPIMGGLGQALGMGGGLFGMSRMGMLKGLLGGQS